MGARPIEKKGNVASLGKLTATSGALHKNPGGLDKCNLGSMSLRHVRQLVSALALYTRRPVVRINADLHVHRRA